jgi:dTDP-L-rhamnose 4-epimerase
VLAYLSETIVMAKRVLITGGAGFIGSHLTDVLLADGYDLRLLDSLTPQVHPNGEIPSYLNSGAELVIGDVRDTSAVEKALNGVDCVVHLASAVGVGQSMYEIAKYTDVNDVGTAVLLDALAKRPVERLVCASSMSIYGEGLGRRPDGSVVSPPDRSIKKLRDGAWEISDADGLPLEPIATPESAPPALTSIYAINKFSQERMCLVAGRAYAIPTVALRFFNVYGPRQALSNPYTGVLAIFASRLLNGQPPLVFEDGDQTRDFVHVLDIADACRRALSMPDVGGEVFNVGSGQARTVNSIADDLAQVMGRLNIGPQVIGKYRAGDIRHCFADITKCSAKLGFSPKIDIKRGLEDLSSWLTGQSPVDHVERATRELESRGLVT